MTERLVHLFDFVYVCQWMYTRWIHKISITKGSNEPEISQSNDYEIREADGNVCEKCRRQRAAFVGVKQKNQNDDDDDDGDDNISKHDVKSFAFHCVCLA